MEDIRNRPTELFSVFVHLSYSNIYNSNRLVWPLDVLAHPHDHSVEVGIHLSIQILPYVSIESKDGETSKECALEDGGKYGLHSWSCLDCIYGRYEDVEHEECRDVAVEKFVSLLVDLIVAALLINI